MKKILIGIVIIGVVLIIGAIVAVSLFLDNALKKGVETLGPQVTRVGVKLDGVNLSLLSGSGSIKGLVVANPEGYKTPNAISVGRASVSLSPSSLLSDKVIIKSIRVEAPEITYELGSGGNNLSQILANVEAAIGGRGTGDKPASSEAGTGKKLQVNEFIITGAKVRVGATVLGGTAPIPLPDIRLDNLGTGPDGITPADLMQQVLKALTDSTMQAVSGALKNLGQDAIGAATKEVGKKAADAVSGAAKGITDLFKKKKD